MAIVINGENVWILPIEEAEIKARAEASEQDEPVYVLDRDNPAIGLVCQRVLRITSLEEHVNRED